MYDTSKLLAFGLGGRYVLTISPIALVDHIALLVPSMALIEAHSSSTPPYSPSCGRTSSCCPSTRGMVVFALAVIAMGKWVRATG